MYGVLPSLPVGHHMNLDSKVGKKMENRQPHAVTPSQDVLTMDTRLSMKPGKAKVHFFRVRGFVFVIDGA